MEKAKAERRAKLEKAFKVFDADGSGTLDSAEMMKILTRESGDCAGMKIEDAKEIIEAFDKNGDGVLNLEEFIECMINLEEVEGFSFGNGEPSWAAPITATLTTATERATMAVTTPTIACAPLATTALTAARARSPKIQTLTGRRTAAQVSRLVRATPGSMAGGG